MTSPSGLWAEGDTLSPTNLNRRNPVGTFPAKLYHVAWATGTGTTQINNAITNANAGGYTGVFVDASRLPYTASAVTFNTAIHMFREGGSLRRDDYEPEAYGAALDGITDDWYAITACAAGATANRGTIRPGAGTLYLSRPWVEQNDLQLVGLPARGGFATAPFSLKCAGGPALVINYTNTFGPLATALVGTGSCYGDGTSQDGRWLDLRDNSNLELNGRAQFCHEFFFKISSAVASRYFLAGSFGGDFSLTAKTCFYITLEPDASLKATLNVAGVLKTVQGAAGAISSNTTYWVALTYDGATVRLFHGTPGGTSILDASTAASGTLTQDPMEIVVPFGQDPKSTNTTLPGYWDSIRTRNTAGYTATGTVPSTKLTVDANTLALINFDLQDGVLTRGLDANNAAWWYWLRFSGSVGSRAQLENVTFQGPASGLLLFAGQGSLLRGLRFEECRDCLVIHDNDWGCTIDSPYINLAGRFGISIGTLSGVITITDPKLVNSCGRFGISVGPSSIAVIGGYIVSGTNTVNHFSLANGNASFFGTSFSCENNSTVQRSILWLTSSAPVSFVGCTFETGNNAPFVTVNTAQTKALFSGCAFNVLRGTTASVLAVTSNPGAPIRFDGCMQISPFIPWTDTAGTAVVTAIGPLSSSSTGGTLNFDASVADEWDLTLSSDVTQSNWTKISYGQPVSGAIKMDSTGSRLFVWPTNSKGTATLSYGSSAVNTFTGFYDGVNVILTSVRTGL